jgi:hypothetical protein
MEAVYSHLHLPYSGRFMEPFRRLFPQRFLWQTAVDWTSGIARDFDASRISAWKSGLTEQQLRAAHSSATIIEFIERFGYER